jgi:hypothetical protein
VNTQVNKEGLIFHGIHQLLHADVVNLFGKNINIMKKNAETLFIGLEVNTEKI